ncbi:hypothetical protein GCM10009548_01830 [Streptomyces malaysiensis subsp. malaysiensis]|uniref:DUF5047 domain-containing protein n=1 Tax=Streptomyces malaysiensis TaxID=92644 RepID=A0ABX6W4G2_STRMQ|nr:MULTISPECIES: DUF5047 domain-containing protein [Streptomyces]QPI56352.1 DUF5047 domain-containing protein [Streptomyces solisilvae]UHH17839.1 DUF5047 domain-containing protein [Streptomyces sp. HNM0561]
MYSVSSRFLATLATSHRMVTTVDAYYNGALVRSNIPVTDGSVTVDRGSKVRRNLSLTVADLSLIPWDVTDPLAVYGQQLVVSRGIQFADGPEMAPLGTFRIDNPSADVHAGPITLTGQSSEAIIQEDAFMVPTTTRGYSTCVEAIQFLIRQTLPDAAIVNLTAGARNPTCPIVVWDAGTDRWDAVVQVATAMQAEIYVDAINRFVIVDVPDPLTSPVVWDVADEEGGTLVSASRTLSRTAVYNAVVVSAENTASGTTPLSAIAYDNDPNSPTRWGGPFGRKPKMVTTALATTQGGCQAIANYMLADLTAPNVQTSASSAPNPALEAGDCIRISAAGRKELSIVQSFTVPLTPEGDFPLTLRASKEDVT